MSRNQRRDFVISHPVCKNACDMMNRAIRTAVLAAALSAGVPAAAENGVADFDDLQSWTNFYNDEKEKLGRELSRRRYDSLVKLLPSLKGQDRQDGLRTAAYLADELEENGDAVSWTRAYLKEFPEGRSMDEVWMRLARALEKTGAADPDVRAAYLNAISHSDTGSRGRGRRSVEYAEFLSRAGDPAGARAVLDRAASELSDTGRKSTRLILDRINQQIKKLSFFGSPTPAFKRADLDGHARSPAAYRGKLLLIDFWATWCGPCVRELPNVQAAYEKFHRKGFDVLGVSLDNDTGTVKKFIKERGMPWTQIFDGPDGWDSGIAALYGVRSIPSTFLVDRKGRVAAVNLRGEALGRKVETILTGKPTADARPAREAKKKSAANPLKSGPGNAAASAPQRETAGPAQKDILELLDRLRKSIEDYHKSVQSEKSVSPDE